MEVQPEEHCSSPAWKWQGPTHMLYVFLSLICAPDRHLSSWVCSGSVFSRRNTMKGHEQGLLGKVLQFNWKSSFLYSSAEGHRLCGSCGIYCALCLVLNSISKSHKSPNNPLLPPHNLPPCKCSVCLMLPSSVWFISVILVWFLDSVHILSCSKGYVSYTFNCMSWSWSIYGLI